MPDMMKLIAPGVYLYGALAIVGLFVAAGDNLGAQLAACLVAGLAYLAQVCLFAYAASDGRRTRLETANNALTLLAVLVWACAWIGLAIA